MFPSILSKIEMQALPKQNLILFRSWILHLPVGRNPSNESGDYAFYELLRGVKNGAPYTGSKIFLNKSWREKAKDEMEFVMVSARLLLGQKPRVGSSSSQQCVIELVAIEWNGIVAYRVGCGYITISWEWDELAPPALEVIKEFMRGSTSKLIVMG